MVKISIIVPVYNVHAYIERCVNSIVCQDTEGFEVECIFVNDNTPDDSIEIVERCLKQYVGDIVFKIVNHSQNQGLSAARNTGVKESTGDFLFFVDSDDRLDPNALKCMMAAVNDQVETPSDIDVVIGNSYICKDRKVAMRFKENTSFYLNNSEEKALKALLDRTIFHTAWNKLVNRKFILNYNILFENGIIDEDLLWSYLVFFYAKGVLVVPQVTYIYEDNPGSIMNTSSSRITNRIKSRILICNTILGFPPSRVCEEYYMYIFYIMIRAIDLYEQNVSDAVECANELDDLKKKFLERVWSEKQYLLYFFFLVSRKPYYAIFKIKFFRRYFDKLEACVTMLNRMFR